MNAASAGYRLPALSVSIMKNLAAAHVLIVESPIDETNEMLGPIATFCCLVWSLEVWKSTLEELRNKIVVNGGHEEADRWAEVGGLQRGFLFLDDAIDEIKVVDPRVAEVLKWCTGEGVSFVG